MRAQLSPTASFYATRRPTRAARWSFRSKSPMSTRACPVPGGFYGLSYTMYRVSGGNLAKFHLEALDRVRERALGLLGAWPPGRCRCARNQKSDTQTTTLRDARVPVLRFPTWRSGLVLSQYDSSMHWHVPARDHLSIAPFNLRRPPGGCKQSVQTAAWYGCRRL